MILTKDERTFFYHLYYRGKQDVNYDADRQFFYYYSLFDHLTKIYAEKHENDTADAKSQRRLSEKDKVHSYLENVFSEEPERTAFQTFNPFKDLKSGNRTRLIASLKNPPIDVSREKSELPPIEAMTALFDGIYDVRCQLFHGGMDLDKCENKQLLEGANIVLQGFLDRLLLVNISANQTEETRS